MDPRLAKSLRQNGAALDSQNTLGPLPRSPEIRMDRVLRAKQAIGEGRYDRDQTLDITIGRILDELLEP